MTWWDSVSKWSDDFLKQVEDTTATALDSFVGPQYQEISSSSAPQRSARSSTPTRSATSKSDVSSASADIAAADEAKSLPALHSVDFHVPDSSLDGDRVATEFKTECFVEVDEYDERAWLQTLVSKPTKAKGRDGALSDTMGGVSLEKNRDEILSGIWTHAASEGLFGRLFGFSNWKTAQLFSKLAHRVDLIYPSADDCTRMLEPHSFNVPQDCDDDQVVNDVRYAVRHAVCAYPPMFCATLGAISLVDMTTRIGVKAASTGSRPLISAAFSIPKSDFLINNLSLIRDVSLHKPNWYLCIDRRAKCIVIGIRGSCSLSDAVTDLNADPKLHSFGDIFGECHEGMLESAHYVYRECMRAVAPATLLKQRVISDDEIGVELLEISKATDEERRTFASAASDEEDSFGGFAESEDESEDGKKPLLIALMQRFSDFKLVITGHSLGAGVSAVLALLLKDAGPCVTDRMHAYCFASPCIVSKNIAENEFFRTKVTTINLANDCVTRLSLESLKQLYRRLDLIPQYHSSLYSAALKDLVSDEDWKREAGSRASDSASSAETASIADMDFASVRLRDAKLRKGMGVFLRDLRQCGQTTSGDGRLYPLGRVVWFVPRVCIERDRYLRRAFLMQLTESPRFTEYCQRLRARELKRRIERSAAPKTIREEPEHVGDEGDDERMDDDWLTGGDGNGGEIEVKEDFEFEESHADLTVTGSAIRTQRRMSRTITAAVQSLTNLFDVDAGSSVASGSDAAKRAKSDSRDNTEIEFIVSKYKLLANATDASAYVPLDATERREVFQDFAFEFNEGFYSHLPHRYLFACGAKVFLD